MNTRILPWITGWVLLLWAGTAQATQTAEAHPLTSGSAATLQQAHPFLSVVLHIVIITVIIGIAGVALSTITNPSSKHLK